MTDVKAAKVLRFVESYDCEAYVIKDLARNPPEVIGVFEHRGERYSVYKSQPVVGAGNFCPGWDMPHMDSEGEIYTLIDLGHGYWADQPFDVEGLGSAARQTPEAILGLGIDTPVDVWSLGCMVFELLIGEPLFNVANVDGTSGEAELLARILKVTGERFSREVLDKARFKDKFFDADGNFMHKKELKPTSIEERLAARKTLPESEVAPAADLIRKCVRLDPADRATAREIFTHPWCYGVFCCGPPY